MALSVSVEAPVGISRGKARGLPQSKARELAEVYLIDKVGDLTSTGIATKHGGAWRFSILLSNARQGLLGEVGAIDVDIESGEISLAQSYEDLLENARRLTPSST